MSDDELRALATAATPGPWKHTALWAIEARDDNGDWQSIAGTHVDDEHNDQRFTDAAYIAAANPATALSLLDRIATLEAESKRLRELVSEWQTARKLVLAEPVANTVTSPSFRDALNRLANAEDALARAALVTETQP